MSGWNNTGDGPAATTELVNYMLDANAHPLWGQNGGFTGRLIVQGNGYGKFSGRPDLGKGGTPTIKPIYRGMQMFDQSDSYSDLWGTMLGYLDDDPLYATYLEIYSESFGYSSQNQANLQANINSHFDASCRVASKDTIAPTISITEPTNNSEVSNPTLIKANASDNTSVSKVDFLIDGSVVYTDALEPYEYSWPTESVPSGTSHSIIAKAYDEAGNIGTSTAITVLKPSINSPPRATINAPNSGSSFTSPATVDISANASDSDGAITKVEFYRGNTKLGEDTTTDNQGNYSYQWNNVPTGSYNLTAKAIDDKNGSSTSPVISIVVREPVASLKPPTFTSPAMSVSWDAGKWQNTIRFAWNPPSDTTNVTGYKVKVTANGNLRDEVTLTGASTNHYNI